MTLQGAAYHWPDLDAAYLDGAYDPQAGWAPPLVHVPPHGWITEPVLGEPDPETGEATVIEPGVSPGPVMALCPVPVPALEHRRIYPIGASGIGA